jgi:Ca2+-transporting ATPase
MGIGIVVQTIFQTGAVLGAFILGLAWHLGAGETIPYGANMLSFVLNYDWRGVDVQTAETMAFVTLSLAELFRAYTVRSERASLFSIGIFSNKYMQYAVGISIALLLIVCATPFPTDIHSFSEWPEWA